MKPFLLVASAVIPLYASGILVKADPNYPVTGLEYPGALTLKVGDYVAYRVVCFGGLLELRNESRFDQRLFPNHSWRGFGFLTTALTAVRGDWYALAVNLGLEHESAHATMGIVEPTDFAYEQIYDNTFRTVDLNALLMGISGRSVKGRNDLMLGLEYQVYFLSKNTPELPGAKRSYSHGLTLSTEWAGKLAKAARWYVSVFDRLIFTGRHQVNGKIFYDVGGLSELRTTSYAVINGVHTVAVKAGTQFRFPGFHRGIDVYLKFLHGHRYGFVDSRDEGSSIAAGLEFDKW